MAQKRLDSVYIFESSWEVCNKVGGIYTVLSTRAKSLQDIFPNRILFIGPDCWHDTVCPYFIEDRSLYASWRIQAAAEGLTVRVGRWDIPGQPVAILVDFQPFFAQKNQIYTEMWQNFGVDSLHAYGDYDEASMFSYAAARVVESFAQYHLDADTPVIYHGNEWMTALGLLYIRKQMPQVATIFTTHATSIGRSIAGNNKPLYEYLHAYNGDQMADELNMQSKHSVEKAAAHHVDCFTTVSDITDRECAELLDKAADVVLPNGFEDAFVPKGAALTAARKAARQKLLHIANCLTGVEYDDSTIIISTNGRNEFRNKGIDVFIDAMHRLDEKRTLSRRVLACIEVPAWVYAPRLDLQERLQTGMSYCTPLPEPYITHWLHNMDQERIVERLRQIGANGSADSRVSVIFIPTYLTGNDGIVDLSYYELLPGNDLCIYPSYYEPWGYTPLEAVAFSVPCVTTDLAGFGLWADKVRKGQSTLTDGVEIVHRTDYNYDEVCESIARTVMLYAQMDKADVTKMRRRSVALSKKALWDKFIVYYKQAYQMALDSAEKRGRNME